MITSYEFVSNEKKNGCKKERLEESFASFTYQSYLSCQNMRERKRKENRVSTLRSDNDERASEKYITSQIQASASSPAYSKKFVRTGRQACTRIYTYVIGKNYARFERFAASSK